MEAMDSSSPLAVASLSPESMVAAPHSVMVMDSETTKDGDSSPEYVMALSSVASKDEDSSPMDSEMLMDSVAPASSEMKVALEMEVVPELAPEMEVVPDSLPPGAFFCRRCDLIHEDRQSWDRSHSVRWPCSRCGLIHRDYDLSAVIYGLDKFDCEILIPDVDNVVMDGETIMLPAHVLEMLDEKRERDRAQAAAKEDAKALVRCKVPDT
ncbi:unnamed protein product [Urochloa humidicola]